MNNDSMGSTQPLTSIPTQRFCIRTFARSVRWVHSSARQGGPCSSVVAVIAVEEEALGSDLADRWKAWKILEAVLNTHCWFGMIDIYHID